LLYNHLNLEYIYHHFLYINYTPQMFLYKNYIILMKYHILFHWLCIISSIHYIYHQYYK